jgi:hypothetical protein
MSDLVYLDENGNIVVTGVRLVCSNTLTPEPKPESPRPECPHCGCSYYVLGDSPSEGICHDCGRLFELPPKRIFGALCQDCEASCPAPCALLTGDDE